MQRSGTENPKSLKSERLQNQTITLWKRFKNSILLAGRDVNYNASQFRD